MKKSIFFGVLAMLALSAMSIQTVEAQNPVKKTTTSEKVAVKPQAASEEKVSEKPQITTKDTGTQENVKDTKKVKEKDCCGNSSCQNKDSKKCDGKEVKVAKDPTIKVKDADEKKLEISKEKRAPKEEKLEPKKLDQSKSEVKKNVK